MTGVWTPSAAPYPFLPPPHAHARRKKVQKDLNEAQAQLVRFNDLDGADASW